ncbi:NAD-dependent succinate-semialdehyde dehydrogenase [Flavobacterium subsaxonicum]|uniref:Succinate-semialdehyde dehydrogenase n=1 Tax=Flavobacterium subsaxonicum WB 4.1-42 = DSM 21790 TaxID=1121898 RepID=A0A0A2MUC6_9FLAO|nr:NAD-dependent succinate-semialdehyde dehydrogenase [Flavobacterium subsaxonicum]KGO95186.1 succinate-semialdehyde dehydrogenase [Flavobacterium subsaxonicum WB 4.1-42 = DSM 21790]
MFSIVNPFNTTFLSEHQYFTGVQVIKILQNSDHTAHTWGAKTIAERLNFIKTLIFSLTKSQHLMAKTCTLEMGKPIKQSVAEVEKCKLLCEYYLKNAEEFLKDRHIAADGSESFVTHEPLGVILGVMPWNFPYWQVFRFAIPAIIAGNTVVVKHASNVAGSAILLEELFKDAGFPEGVYTNLLIAGDQVKEVIDNPIIKAVSLTGSEKAGTSVASAAAAQVKKSVLELGGSNALIICADADLETAVPIAITARFQNTGQSCIAAKRFLVHSSIFDVFMEKFIKGVAELKSGDPMDEATYIGPLARVDLAEEVEKQVNDSVAMGAKIAIGGKRNNAFYEPTVLTNVTADMPVFAEEVFGPAVPVVPFDTLEEAVKLSNATGFGLGVSVFTTDVDAIKSKISLFQEGAVFINAMVKSDPALPFGGIKRSGFGRELAENGIKEFVNVKTVFIA